jgi:hypothetical protein
LEKNKILENALLKKNTICGCRKMNINIVKIIINAKRAGMMRITLLL